MKTISYQDLINSKAKYNAMLTRLDIKDKKNRWDVAYNLISELEKARLNGKIDDIDSTLLGRMRFALTDLDNMKLILDQFPDDNSKIFKSKFSEILKGAVNQVDEISTGSSSRDIQLELLMCAKFREAGLDAQLGDPHPDILVRVNGRKYGFECKRIFNANQGAVQKNIEKAIKQLNINFLDRDYSKRGVPLLCIDRYITGGNKVLSAKDEITSRKQLGDEIENFVKQYYKRWSAPKVKQQRMIGVFIFMNITTMLQTEGMQVVSSQSGVSDSGWVGIGRMMFDDFIYDIAQHMGSMDRSKIS